MIMRQMLSFLKDILRQIIISLCVAGALALGTLIPVTRPYLLPMFWFTYNHWVEGVAIIGFILGLMALVKLRTIGKAFPDLDARFNNLQSLSSKELENKIDSKSVEFDEKVLKVSTSIKELVTKVSASQTKVSDLANDVYEMKRPHLLREARDYQANNKRGALLCRLDVVELDLEKKDDFNLQDSLRELYSYVKSETSFSTKDLSDTKNILEKITDSGNKDVAEQILKLIKDNLH